MSDAVEWLRKNKTAIAKFHAKLEPLIQQQEERRMKDILPIGTKTQWGIIQGVGFVGERYYWIINKYGVVSMFPATLVESIYIKKERMVDRILIAVMFGMLFYIAGCVTKNRRDSMGLYVLSTIWFLAVIWEFIR